MGQTIRRVWKRDNPVVDRRATVFAGDTTKKVEADKPSEEKKDEPAAGTAAEKKADDSGEGKTGDDVPKVPPKQGGCGCKLAGESTPSAALPALAFAAALALRRRRRPGSRAPLDR